MANRRDALAGAFVREAELNLVDWDQFDPNRWPHLDLDAVAPEDAWCAYDALDRLGLAKTASTSTEALLRLWRRGKRTTEKLVALRARPHLVYAPPWVAELLRGGGLPALLDEELVAAAEAVARLSPSEVDAMVAVRQLVAGEPPPLAGGWRRSGGGEDQAPKADGDENETDERRPRGGPPPPGEEDPPDDPARLRAASRRTGALRLLRPPRRARRRG